MKFNIFVRGRAEVGRGELCDRGIGGRIDREYGVGAAGDC